MSNTIATTISNDQTSETSNVVTLRNNQKNENSSNEAADSVQNVTSNTESNVSAENKAPSTENATLKSDTPEVSAPVESNANTSAAPAMRMATSTTTGYDRNAAGIVNRNNINTQPAKENQELANKTNLTSSDNYSSNIYKGKDENYYKIVTIYGNDYVYRAADIQANGTALFQKATTAEDTKNNINISKKDLGNGKTRWTVVFFPHKGLQNVGSNLSGLTSAKFGIALTSDYQIDGNVDMDVISDPNQTFLSHTFKPGSNRSTDITVQNPPAEVKFSFNPNTDVDPNTGLINSETMPAYNNKYLQGPYYFTTATNTGARNLWQTYFKDNDEYNNAYDGSPYLGGDHDFHFSTFKIANENVVDGAKYEDPIIYDTLGHRLNGVAISEGVFNSDNFNQAMEFKSQGDATNIFIDRAQYSSYVISFTTQHTDSYEIGLITSPKNQQFSGISANIYSYQNGYYSMFSSLYGEQRALNPAGALLNPKDIIPNWVPANTAMGQIHTEYLNNAQINVLRNKIQNNITDSDALNNIIKEGNPLNDAMKNLGNSIGQYDSDGKFTDHKVDTTKASDRYQYADSDTKSTYDNTTNAVSNIIDKSNGTYADQATVEKLTDDENKAWSALNGVKPTDTDKITPNVPEKKVPVANTSNLTETEKDQVKKNVEDANKGNFPDGTVVTVGADGTATVTYPDKSTDTINGSDLVRPETPETEADKITPNVPEKKVPVANTSNLTETEKDQVKTNVTDANKGNLPSGSQITVGNDGTTTVTYPDGSKDTIPGDKVVEGKSDADKNESKVPGDKVKVDDPNKLTDSEKEELSNNLEKLNPGTVVTIADDGTATVTYPDGSTNTISGSQLVTAKGNGNTTNSNVKVTPTNTNNKINKDNNSLGKNTANAKAGELPQTGETNDSQKLSVIGMALMGILGLFGLGKKRKKD